MPRSWLRAIVRLSLQAATLVLAMASAVDAADDAVAGAAPVLRVYVREGCPHCADAKAFLSGVASTRPSLRIEFRPVDSDPAARDELLRLSSAAGVWPPGVPTFEIDGRVLVGFDAAGGTGRELLALIDRGASVPVQVETRWLGTLSEARLGLPLFTLALGLLDGFNPCAMWVLLFLLSVLLRLQDRRRIALVAGTFVVVSGAVYFAFMAAWLNLFLAVGWSEAVRIGLALLALGIAVLNLKDFVAPGHGPTLSIPRSTRPGLVARMHHALQQRAPPAMLIGVAALAVVVNFVELLCTAGLPAIYTAVLTQQALSPAAHYAYLGLYVLGYIADDTLMVATAVLALGSGKLGKRGGRMLKLLSGLVMLALGFVLLLRPQWLV